MPLFSIKRKWEGALPAVSQETCLTTHGSMDDGKVHSRILLFGCELFCLPTSGRVVFLFDGNSAVISNAVCRYLCRGGQGLHHLSLSFAFL